VVWGKGLYLRVRIRERGRDMREVDVRAGNVYKLTGLLVRVISYTPLYPPLTVEFLDGKREHCVFWMLSEASSEEVLEYWLHRVEAVAA
jgi:hypothetical protein